MLNKYRSLIVSFLITVIGFLSSTNIIWAYNSTTNTYSSNLQYTVSSHSTAHLKGPGFSDIVTVANIHGIKEGIFEGDILVSQQNDDFNRTNGNVVSENNDNLWPNQTLYYKLMGTSTNTNRMVQLATKYISDRTNVRFIRLSENDESKHHVRVYDSYSGLTSLCASHVGRTNLRAGYQNLYLIGGCGLDTAIHEFLHALGVWHEHSRKDRDKYVTIHWNKIHDSTKHNFEIKTDSVSVGPYDFNSIMHYPFWAFNVNFDSRTKTISSKVPGKQVTYWNSEMSKGDIASINYLYPHNNSPSESEPVRSQEEIAKMMGPIISLLFFQ